MIKKSVELSLDFQKVADITLCFQKCVLEGHKLYCPHGNKYNNNNKIKNILLSSLHLKQNMNVNFSPTRSDEGPTSEFFKRRNPWFVNESTVMIPHVDKFTDLALKLHRTYKKNK